MIVYWKHRSYTVVDQNVIHTQLTLAHTYTTTITLQSIFNRCNLQNFRIVNMKTGKIDNCNLPMTAPKHEF